MSAMRNLLITVLAEKKSVAKIAAKVTEKLNIVTFGVFLLSNEHLGIQY
jgi:hypothetical protein